MDSLSDKCNFKGLRFEFVLGVMITSVLIVLYLYPDISNLRVLKYLSWIVVFVGALPIIVTSFRHILARTISIEVFNLFALSVAVFLSNIGAALWIELMLIFASYLEWKTKSRASEALLQLINLAPETAHMINEDQTYTEVLQKDLIVGNILLVKEGEKIPSDGQIIYGEGTIDESSFTGEFLPQEKKIGDTVFSATILVKGVIKVRVTAVGRETVLGKMVVLMKDALLQKSKAHKFADRFAEIFLPITIIVAIVIYIFTRDIVVVAAFLIIICADDIAVAIPLAMEAVLGRAAKRGVIVKGGISIEKLSKVKTVVFDKTGTLTHAKFSVDTVLIEAENTEDEFWFKVAVAEKFSEHPIGKALFLEAVKRIDIIPDPENVKILSGAGVRVTYLGKDVIIGNKKAMDREGIQIPGEIAIDENYKNETALYVALNNKYIGSIYVSDTIKDEARETISILNKMGIKTVMLTGDRMTIANDIGERLGLNDIRAELSPEDKIRCVEELKKDGVVVMVGDGVNDALALSAADVGIAMGKLGSSVSVEAADIVIQTDNLLRIPEMIKLAKTTKAVIINNFIIWFITNTVGTILVLTRIATLPIAAFYNFASDFIPLLNSARLFRNKR